MGSTDPNGEGGSYSASMDVSPEQFDLLRATVTATYERAPMAEVKIVRDNVSQIALVNLKMGDTFRLLDYPNVVWALVGNYGAVYSDANYKPKERDGYLLCVCIADGREHGPGKNGYNPGFLRWVSGKEIVEKLKLVEFPQYEVAR